MDQNSSTGNLRFIAIYICIIGFLSGACKKVDIVNQPVMTDRKVTMDLVSNRPDTTFSFRKQRLDAGPEEDWEIIGTGQEVTAYLFEGGRYEISAKPIGYREKRVKFTEPINRYLFRFLEADRFPEVAATEKPLCQVEEPHDSKSNIGESLSIKPASKSVIDVGKKWAVIIGISEYQQRGKWGLANLRYAGKDATEMARYLQSPQGGRFDHVRLLANQEATVQSIKMALRENLRSVQENDLVLVFWAGHGTPDPHEPDKLYLLGYDSDPEHMASSAYAMDEFQRDIQNLKANQVILVADACHSAGLSDPTQAVRGEVENRIIEGLRGVTIGPAPATTVVSAPGADLTLAGRSNLIFTSCEAGEKSLESSTLDGGHGVFTYFILEGLRGAADRLDNNGNADGIVSLGEMVDYATDRVKRFSQNQQHPDTAGRFDRDLTMGIVK